MENSLNTGNLETLTPGQTLIVQAIKVNGGKIQLEFAERMSTPDRPQSLLAAFNKSDDRFSQSAGARRCWYSVQPEDASELLGVDLTNLKYTTMTVGDRTKEVSPLNILNPTIDGQRVRIQIKETTTPTGWQADNIDVSAKRRGAEGEFITHKGMHIFSNTDIVLGEPKHTFLEADAVASESMSGVYANVDIETGELLS